MENQFLECAFLVQVDFKEFDSHNSLKELRALTESAGAKIVGSLQAKHTAPDAKFFIGKGKMEELKTQVLATQATLVIFNHTLSATQERNIARFLNVRVIDRNTLILDIFALRAQSFEGRLQVELAQLTHLATRLVGTWTHLERQKGGIGLRGPGERQLEIDRRLLAQRVKYLNARLSKLEKSRQTQRGSTFRKSAFNVSLVGYTNAGKSTLFNALTHEKVYSADQLFATLDTTSRKLWLEQAQESMVLTDTVGFIRNLPHALVKAFHATLEVSVEADLLLHVIDFSSPVYEDECAAVNAVLKEIGADSIPQLLVLNKTDLKEDCARFQNNDLNADFEKNSTFTVENRLKLPNRIFLSAKNGDGLENLRQILAQYAICKRQTFI